MNESNMTQSNRETITVNQNTDIELKRCPYCAEHIRAEATKCRFCGSMLAGSALTTSWYRLQHGKMIAGVCAGLAEAFGISVTALRLAAVVLALLGAGWGIILYIVLWIIMPIREQRADHLLPR